jgi:transcriptional regulator with XRE-family HTH domain
MSRLQLLGKNIRKYREAKKFSQEILAEKAELSREYITRIENGQKSVSLRKLFLLADILEVKISDLTDFD